MADWMTLLALVCVLVTASAQNNCKSLQVIAKGALPSGAYTVKNSAGQSFRIYCLFKDGYGYTFLSKNTNIAVDMGSLYDDKTHVLVRFTKSNKQYESTLAQIDSFASVPLSVQYNGYTGYNRPINFEMTPYIYVGFIPKSYTSKGARQGWKTNGQEQIFTNCDANPNSYIMFMFNNAHKAYTSNVGSKNSLMYKWYDDGTLVSSSDYVSSEFLTIYHEIHHGGCGGYSRGSNVPTFANIGLKFTIQCAVPVTPTGATMTYSGTAIGDTATYVCKPGYQQTGGDTTRKCGGSGKWLGSAIVCTSVQCAVPVTAAGATMTYSGTAIGETATYQCKPGYQKTGGDTTRKCGGSGQWLGAAIVCTTIQCAVPVTPTGATMTYSGTSIGDTATFGCKPGYQKTGGDTTRKCGGSGQWLGSAIVCTTVQCAVPVAPTGAFMTYSGTAVGDTATYRCKTGYQQTGGDTSMKCGGSGQWLGSDIVCTMSEYGIAIFCERTKGHLRCLPGKKLAIYSAMYGRTEGDTICDHRSARKTSNTKCIGSPKTFTFVRALCNNRQVCYLAAKNSVFRDPCRGTYKYLEVRFACVNR